MKHKEMFFWNYLAFIYDPMDVGNLFSGSSAFYFDIGYIFIEPFSLQHEVKGKSVLFKWYFTQL